MPDSYHNGKRPLTKVECDKCGISCDLSQAQLSKGGQWTSMTSYIYSDDPTYQPDTLPTVLCPDCTPLVVKFLIGRGPEPLRP